MFGIARPEVSDEHFRDIRGLLALAPGAGVGCGMLAKVAIRPILGQGNWPVVRGRGRGPGSGENSAMSMVPAHGYFSALGPVLGIPRSSRE